MFKLGDHVKKVRGTYNLGMTGVVVGTEQNMTFTNLTILIRSDAPFIIISSFNMMPAGAGGAGDQAWGNPAEWEKIAPWDAQTPESMAEELGEEEEEDHELVVCR